MKEESTEMTESSILEVMEGGKIRGECGNYITISKV